jgi:hypothetical protein
MAMLKDVLYDPDPDGQGSGTDSGTTNETDTSSGGDQTAPDDQATNPAP